MLFLALAGMWTNKQGTRVLARSEFTLAELVALGLVNAHKNGLFMEYLDIASFGPSLFPA